MRATIVVVGTGPIGALALCVDVLVEILCGYHFLLILILFGASFAVTYSLRQYLRIKNETNR